MAAVWIFVIDGCHHTVLQTVQRVECEVTHMVLFLPVNPSNSFEKSRAYFRIWDSSSRDFFTICRIHVVPYSLARLHSLLYFIFLLIVTALST